MQGAIEEPVVNVCTGEPTATRELAQVLAGVIGTSPELRDGPRRAGDVERSVLQAGRMAQSIPPTPLAQGLRETVAWFKARPRS
jgi:nucleoside-diphosphate-sugar epimerase